jgi:N-acetylglutamate synthase-like GNAT family acetyltransferase
MSEDRIEIAPYTQPHQDGVLAVILPIQQHEFQIPITVEAQTDLQDIEHFYQKDDGNFWVALAEGRVVGTIALLDIGDHTAALRKMFVAAEWRGAKHRVAAKLLETLFAWSRNRNIERVYLGTTAKFLAAHRFYEKNGFDEIERTDLPPAFPVLEVDTKFYVARLENVGR